MKLARSFSVMGKKVAYAVKKGRKTGIFPTWEEASKHVNGFPGAVYKGFASLDEAKSYMGDSVATAAASAAPAFRGGGGRDIDLAGGRGSSFGQSGSGRKPDGVPTMSFGKHQGKTFLEVALSSPDYYQWAKSQKKMDGQLKDFVQWCDKQQNLGLLSNLGDASPTSTKTKKRARPQAAASDDDDGFVMFFDGGSRGNGTPRAVAGSGACIFRGKEMIWSAGRFLGGVTNNVAEYDGLILGLEGAAKLGISRLKVFGDSKLVVNQVQGLWKCNFPHLQTVLDDARRKMDGFEGCEVTHVLRDGNSDADALANRAMDMRKDFEEKHDVKKSKQRKDDAAGDGDDDLIDPAERKAGGRR